MSKLKRKRVEPESMDDVPSPPNAARGETVEQSTASPSDRDVPALLVDLVEVLNCYLRQHSPLEQVINSDVVSSGPSWSSLQERVVQHTYHTSQEFQKDFDEWYEYFIEKQPTFRESLGKFWELGTALLSQPVPLNPHHSITEHDTSLTKLTMSGQTRHNPFKRVALMRSTPSGYLFSNAVDILPTEELPVGETLDTLTLFPAVPLAPASVPRLGTVDPNGGEIRPVRVAKHPRSSAKVPRPLNYGAYSSCFPMFDSSQATLGLRDVPLCLTGERPSKAASTKVRKNEEPTSTSEVSISEELERVIQKYQMEPDVTSHDTNLDYTLLNNMGINVEQLLSSLSSQDTSDSTATDAIHQHDINSWLQRNAELVAQLEQHQAQRLIDNDSDGLTPSKAEFSTAQKIQQYLERMLALTPPSRVTNRRALQHAMECLPSTQLFYRGTLSVDHCFAFPSNAQHTQDYPPNATR
ncbi:hypothetical protein IWQ61_002069 [Dispira simplex]|nr:hypothetical protein IWQ61_002069 [Dispira simplex]